MGIFFGDRDWKLFNGIAQEVISHIVNIKANIYKVNASKTIENLYGESLKKVFFNGVQLAALIAHDDPSYDEEEFGIDINQTIQMRFNRNMLKHYKYVPEIGDIVEYDTQYFEITSVIQNRFFGGDVNKRLETICDAILTSDTVPELTRIKKAAIESNLYGE